VTDRRCVRPWRRRPRDPPDPVVAGWPNTTPVIVLRLPSIQLMARKAKQPPAPSSRAGLDADKPVVPSNVLVLCTLPATGSRRARCVDDARDTAGASRDRQCAPGRRQSTRCRRRSRSGRFFVAVWVMPSDRACIHAGNKPVCRAGSQRARTAAMLFADGSSTPAAPAVRLTALRRRWTQPTRPVRAGGRCRDIGVGERDRGRALADP